MSFASFEFLWFFMAFLVLYALVYSFAPIGLRKPALLLGSLVFCWLAGFFTTKLDQSIPEAARDSRAVSDAFLGLATMISFAVVSYLFGVLIQNGGTRKRTFLLLGVGVNAFSLLVFKLSDFHPIGVSYYLFTSIAYLTDVYRGTIAAERSPLAFGVYIAAFPKLIQGPITRYGELAPELERPKYTLRNLQAGLASFVIGFAMQVLVSNQLKAVWDSEIARTGYEFLSTRFAWYGLLCYCLYIYLSWQSYMLMAIGIGRILGFRLPQNFNYPYLAKSVGDFYRRWHMTLTRWFKDYIYIPLGGNRKGLPRTVINILIVWLVTALWHGFHWNFVIWGMSLGLLVVLEKLWLGKHLQRLQVLPHLYVLFVIPMTWICFAMKTPADIGAYLARLFPFFGSSPYVNEADVVEPFRKTWIPALAGIVLCFPFVEHLLQRFHKSWFVSILLAILFWLSVYMLQKNGSSLNNYAGF